jgi:hypothetical protein
MGCFLEIHDKIDGPLYLCVIDSGKKDLLKTISQISGYKKMFEIDEGLDIILRADDSTIERTLQQLSDALKRPVGAARYETGISAGALHSNALLAIKYAQTTGRNYGVFKPRERKLEKRLLN